MTEGKSMFLILLLLVVGVAIGEIAYRLKRRKMRKDSNLSDYGISLEICRAQYYFLAVIGFISVICAFLYLAYMIYAWDKPI